MSVFTGSVHNNGRQVLFILAFIGHSDKIVCAGVITPQTNRSAIAMTNHRRKIMTTVGVFKALKMRLG